MERRGEKPSDWPVVITIHGIRTTGDWQREFTDVLTQHGFRHVPLGFGFFKAVSLLMPWSRTRKVEWFRRIYSDKFASTERLPSVVAHSFGSYIVTKAMLKYDDIRFDKVILCGSIVSRKYPWSTVLTQRNQADAVLNEAGGRDMWAGIVEWLVSDAGSSGVSGFEDMADGRLTQLIHERHEHSDYFYRQNFERRWVPFLSGAAVQKVIPAGDDGMNWKFAFTASAFFALILLAAALGLSEQLRSRALQISDSLTRKIEAATTDAAQESPSQVAKVASTSGDVTGGKTRPIASDVTVRGATDLQARLNGKTGSTLDTAQNSRANLADAKVQSVQSHETGDDMRQMFEFLRGEWKLDGMNLPEKTLIVAGGRCRTRERLQASIVFKSIDAEKAKLIGVWKKHSLIKFEFVASRDTNSSDAIYDGRRACLTGYIQGNISSSSSDEEGVLEASETLWGMHQKALATLNIENCKIGDMDCESSRFGKIYLPSIEKISSDRIRIGEMMFVRLQASP